MLSKLYQFFCSLFEPTIQDPNEMSDAEAVEAQIAATFLLEQLRTPAERRLAAFRRERELSRARCVLAHHQADEEQTYGFIEATQRRMDQEFARHGL